MPSTTTNPWAPYEPSASAPWNLTRVVHLHRRAAFGAPWEVIQRDLDAGPQAAIDRVLSADAQADAGFATLANTIGDAAMASGSPGRLKAWWMLRMLTSPDPLGERLTLMWHNHFATSNLKVDNLVWMREQNDRMRQHARAPFGELLRSVVKHPAMLTWLDADSNRKGRPNENLARELMELFTLGAGEFTEPDVKDAARALTGWTVVSGSFGVRAASHDDAEKTVLARTGPLDGDGLVERLLDHPATARRVAWRVCDNFMGEGVVDDAALDELADTLRASGLDIGGCVATVIRSELYFSKPNLRSRITSPAEHVVGTLRALDLCQRPPSTLLLAEWAERMGQDLFYPPNVGGWHEGRAWLSSRAVVARANFAAALVEGRLWRPPRDLDLAGALEQEDVTSQAKRLAELLWGEAPPSVVKEAMDAATPSDRRAGLPAAAKRLLGSPYHFLG